MSDELLADELADRRRAATSSALRALIAVQRRALELDPVIDRDLRQAGWDAIDAGLDALIELLPRG